MTIRKNCPGLYFNAVMTDDEEKYIKVLRDAFEGQEIKHLPCTFHIKNAWMRKLNITSRKHAEANTKAEIKKHLDALLRARDEEKFQQLCDSFVSEVQDKDKDFAEYFIRHYLSRTDTRAMCRRRFPHSGIETDNHSESFHNQLKTNILEKNKHPDRQANRGTPRSQTTALPHTQEAH